MPGKTAGRTKLSSAGMISPVTYELCGDQILARLFGIFRIQEINLAAVYYLRLATRSEMPLIHQLFNWIHFLPHRRSLCPVYVLQTRSHAPIFLKLDGTTHFTLRQAIGRHNETTRRNRLAA